MYDRHRGRAV